MLMLSFYNVCFECFFMVFSPTRNGNAMTEKPYMFCKKKNAICQITSEIYLSFCDLID